MEQHRVVGSEVRAQNPSTLRSNTQLDPDHHLAEWGLITPGLVGSRYI